MEDIRARNLANPGFVSPAEYLKLPRDPETWLIKDLLPSGGTAVLYSPPKVGKSALALQLTNAIGGDSKEWMGFDVCRHGRVLYLQLDTPRSTWALRFEALRKHGYMHNDDLVKIADNESIGLPIVDVLQPVHMEALKAQIKPWNPVLVVIDTLRKTHTGDENSSTIMSNVISSLKAIVNPSALLIISHERKPNPDADKDLMSDMRGSTSVVGEMDAILRLTKTRLRYAGRNIEESDLKLIRQDADDVLLWQPDPDEYRNQLQMVMNDDRFASMRSKARELARLTGCNEEKAMSTIRRRGARFVGKTPA